MKLLIVTVVLLFAVTMVAQQEYQSNSLPNNSSMATQAPTMANSDVLYQIQSQLSTSPELNNSGVTATVTDNAVILSGWINNEQRRQEADAIAEQFSDNRQVIDHIQLGGSPGEATPTY